MDALDAVKIESALAAQAARDAADDEVGQNDFLTMLVAQLENQDPLNPQDSADFAAQLAQFSSVEQLIAVREGIDKLVASAEAPVEAAPTSAASSIDPTNLVGREVTVFGSQIEVDAERSVVTMDYRSIDPAIEAEVVIRDADGNVRHVESLLPLDAAGKPTDYLRPGDHVYRLDPREHTLPEGVYSIEFIAKGQQGTDVTLLPMISGRVTGAILAGEPSIRMGNRIFSVEDVLEVRLSDAERASGSADRVGEGTGGPRERYAPVPSAQPRPAGV